MPIYVYRCQRCFREEERIQSRKEREHALTASEPYRSGDRCYVCGGVMDPALGSVCFRFATRTGASIGFSSNRGPKGNRKPKTIGEGHGLGGHRPNPSFAKGKALALQESGPPGSTR